MSLNPKLLNAISKAIPYEPRIINHNEPMECYYEPDVQYGGQRLRIIRRGETYISCCPFCNDKRYRLAVNHRYDVEDNQTGYKGRELWKCYNEECQHEPKNREKLQDMLEATIGTTFKAAFYSIRVPAPIIRIGPPKLEPCEFPGLLIPISELSNDHHAAKYLIDRHFDLQELYAEWGVSYAVSVPMRSRGAMSQDRIIIPVLSDGVTVGWQARYVGELDWKKEGIPKYLTYFPKSLAVYGLDAAKDADVFVLVEGVTDVWRYGRGAICGLGKGLSPTQVQLVADAIGDRPLILIPDSNDPQSEPKFVKAAWDIRQRGYKGFVNIVLLKAGTDPAKWPRDVLRKHVIMNSTALDVVR